MFDWGKEEERVQAESQRLLERRKSFGEFLHTHPKLVGSIATDLLRMKSPPFCGNDQVRVTGIRHMMRLLEVCEVNRSDKHCVSFLIAPEHLDFRCA